MDIVIAVAPPIATEVSNPSAGSLPLNPDTSLAPLYRIWLLRFLVTLKGYRSMTGPRGFTCPALAVAVGLGMNTQRFRSRDGRLSVRDGLTAQLAELEGREGSDELPQPLADNLHSLSQVLKLGVLEQRFLALAVLLHGDERVEAASETVGRLSRTSLHKVLGTVLGVTPDEIRRAVRSDGNLVTSGLIRMDYVIGSSPRGMIDLLSRELVEGMLLERSEPICFLRGRVQAAPAPTLPMDAFAESVPSLNKFVVPFLRGAFRHRRKGTNLLFIGPAGLGKSQATRTIAAELRMNAYEVSFADSDGDPLGGSSRVRAFNVAQQLLGDDTRSLLVFDEASDVFLTEDPFHAPNVRDMPHKAFLNRSLEDSRTISIWITNSPPCDPAVLRRFCAVIEFKPPEEAIRHGMLKQMTGDLVSDQTIKALAANPSVSPAVVESACRMVRDAEEWLEPTARDAAVRELVDANLRFGHGESLAEPASNPTVGEDQYDPKFLNADHDLEALADALGSQRHGRVLLAGPPGTGKTAYAGWVAKRLAAPLHVVSLADILNAYLGATEKATAAAFREAERAGAVLCFDEVDSLLAPRTRAGRTFELQQTNQMLVSLESYRGILIASTNLFNSAESESHVDPAALRRFDLVVTLKTATRDQLMALLEHHTCQLQLPAPSPEQLERISRLELTPGDFAAVRRRAKLLPLAATESLVEALERQHALKNPTPHRNPIGFTR